MGSPVSAVDAGTRRDLVLQRAGKANAVDPAMVDLLIAELERAEADGIGLLVLRSAGPVFCAGFDLDEALGTRPAEADAADAAVADRLLGLARLLDRWRAATLHTACLVDGAAAGVGADLAAACDTRLGTMRARFRFPGSRFGLLLGTTHLARLVGANRATEIVTSARLVDAQEAHRLGLLDHVGDAAELDERLDELAGTLGRVSISTVARLAVAVRPADPAENHRLVTESCAEPGIAERVRLHRDRALRRSAATAERSA